MVFVTDEASEKAEEGRDRKTPPAPGTGRRTRCPVLRSCGQTSESADGGRRVRQRWWDEQLREVNNS